MVLNLRQALSIGVNLKHGKTQYIATGRRSEVRWRDERHVKMTRPDWLCQSTGTCPSVAGVTKTISQGFSSNQQMARILYFPVSIYN